MLTLIIRRRLVFILGGNHSFHFPFKNVNKENPKKRENIYKQQKMNPKNIFFQKTLIYDNRLVNTALENQWFKIM